MTSFEPFYGARTNNSMNVADELESQLRTAGYKVETCLLPVVYDQAAERAKECFNRISPAPSIVISLGEAYCDLEVEDIVYNQDATPGVPDNAGVIRVAQSIVSGAEKYLSLTPLASRLYCALDDRTRAKVQPSSSAANFVCNNTGFRLGLHFRAMRVPYDFIHVPNHNCGIAAADSAAKITSMIAGAHNKPTDSCIADFKSRAAAHKY